jgi:type II secretory pathway pseudopilin PulG
MFNLIVTIISIALVAVLAIATIYYGGSAFSKQGSEAETARLLNSAAHLKGAIEMYRTDHAGTPPASLETDLTPHYLKSLPSGALDAWQISDGFVRTKIGDSLVGTGVTQDDVNVARSACESINKKLGQPVVVPSCADPALSSVQVCCDTDLAYTPA